MNIVRLIKNVNITSRIFSPRYYTLYSNNQILLCNNQISRNSKSSCLKVSLNPMKCISNYNSMQTKDSDPVGEKDDSNKARKILEDEDIQSILKDFANDFGVDNETNELLDDIRKNIDEDYKNSCQTENLRENKDLSSSIISDDGIHKYKEFSDSDSRVIYSHGERNEETEAFYHIDDELKPRMPYRELKRGVTGVFDLHELIEVLRNESLFDIATISVPKELHYTDYLVLATARSERHNAAAMESINKIYKQKKNLRDPFLKIEGDNTPNWKVLDMGTCIGEFHAARLSRGEHSHSFEIYSDEIIALGNIVLHLFLEETRALYDIESLWLFESQYDSGGNAPSDPMLNIIEEQMEFFNSLQQQQNSTEIPKDPS